MQTSVISFVLDQVHSIARNGGTRLTIVAFVGFPKHARLSIGMTSTSCMHKHHRVQISYETLCRSDLSNLHVSQCYIDSGFGSISPCLSAHMHGCTAAITGSDIVGPLAQCPITIPSGFESNHPIFTNKERKSLAKRSQLVESIAADDAFSRAVLVGLGNGIPQMQEHRALPTSFPIRNMSYVGLLHSSSE